MRNTLSVLAIALVATWGTINLGCAPSESPSNVSNGSTSSAPATTPVAVSYTHLTLPTTPYV